jgi:hypothetical protein
MRNIFTILLSILLFSSTSIFADVLEYDVKNFDFGSIKEADGKVKHVFKYQNKSKNPIVISSVRSSCGCAIPSYSRKPIMPNEKGVLEVTYDPRRRPGTFHKTITVNTNQGKDVLRITGKVIPKPRSLTDEFPVNKNGLRFVSDIMSLGTVVFNRARMAYFDVVNFTDKEMTLEFVDVPSHITVKGPDKLRAKEKNNIEIAYNPKKKNDWGYVTDLVKFKVNGKLQKITLSGNIVDDVVSISHAAKVKVDKRFVNLGKREVGEKVEHIVKIKNTGKTNLYIRKITTNNKLVTFQIPTKFLKPNEETEMKVEMIVPNGKRAVYNKVQMVTNDPTSWTTTVRFALRVKK